MAMDEPATGGTVGGTVSDTTSDQPPSGSCPSLDTTTRQRLEQIIESTSMPDHDQQKLFAAMGSGEKARQYEEQQERRVRESQNEHIEEIVAKLRKRKSKVERGMLLLSLRDFHYRQVDEKGITHPALEEIFQGTYKLAVEERWYDLAIHLGEEHLHLPAKQLQGMRESEFYSTIVSPHRAIPSSGDAGDRCIEAFNEYIQEIREGAKDIPPARQQQFARKAYPELLQEWDNHKDRFIYLFQAALLAREYNLGREKVLEPIKRYFSFYETAKERGNLKGLISRDFKAEDYRPPSYEFLEKLIEAFDLPAPIVHKQMQRLFSTELWGLHYKDTALRIMARNILTEDEITRMVNENYLETLEGGNFTSALGIREKLGQYIGQEKVGLEDLRLLAKIEEGVRLNRQ